MVLVIGMLRPRASLRLLVKVFFLLRSSECTALFSFCLQGLVRQSTLGLLPTTCSHDIFVHEPLVRGRKRWKSEGWSRLPFQMKTNSRFWANLFLNHQR